MANAIKNKKAQSILEYVILIVIVISAMTSIQVYIKRANMGRLKSAVDQASDAKQFSPDESNLAYSLSSSSNKREILNTDGSSSTALLTPEITNSESSDDFSGRELSNEKIFP